MCFWRINVFKVSFGEVYHRVAMKKFPTIKPTTDTFEYSYPLSMQLQIMDQLL